jgi:hypothetical protein
MRALITRRSSEHLAEFLVKQRTAHGHSATGLSVASPTPNHSVTLDLDFGHVDGVGDAFEGWHSVRAHIVRRTNRWMRSTKPPAISAVFSIVPVTESSVKFPSSPCLSRTLPSETRPASAGRTSTIPASLLLRSASICALPAEVSR